MAKLTTETFSEHFNIPKCTIDRLGIFDRFMNIDSNYYIERRLLCKNKYFEAASNHLDSYMRYIVSSEEIIRYNISKLNPNFNEAKNIGLGTSLYTTEGRGTGKEPLEKLQKILLDALHSNIKDLEQLIYVSNTLVNGIGKDKTSDFIANVINEHIVNYTKEMCNKLNIDYSKLNGMLLLPRDILVKMPLDYDWREYKNNITEGLLIEILNNKINTDEIGNSSEKTQLYNEIIEVNKNKVLRDNAGIDDKDTLNNICKLHHITINNINEELVKHKIINKNTAKILVSRLIGCNVDTESDYIFVNKIQCKIVKYEGKYILEQLRTKNKRHKRYKNKYKKHKLYIK